MEILKQIFKIDGFLVLKIHNFIYPLVAADPSLAERMPHITDKLLGAFVNWLNPIMSDELEARAWFIVLVVKIIKFVTALIILKYVHKKPRYVTIKYIKAFTDDEKLTGKIKSMYTLFYTYTDKYVILYVGVQMFYYFCLGFYFYAALWNMCYFIDSIYVALYLDG
jgi:hypothetical protein